MSADARTPRVGYLTSSMSNHDGWGRYSRSLIESVSQQVDVCVLTDAVAQNETKVSEVLAVLPPMKFNLVAQFRVFLAAMHHLRGCDVIHSLVETYAPGAALASRLLGAKFVMTMHGTYSIPPAGWSIQGMLVRFALKSAALTTTGSRYTEKKARRRVKFGECRFIPNGVDLHEFHKIDGLQRKNFILTVGWLKPRKGMDVFIKAFGLLQQKYPALEAFLVGSPDKPAFYEHLKKLATQTGAPERVHFLGRIEDSELVRLYNTCKVFVFPARDIHENFEGFPMVFYEANACGTPVVTTRGFGSEYAIQEGKNGLLVEADDVPGTAAAIERLLDDSELYEKMCKESLRIAQEHTWDKIALKLVEFYQDAREYKS